MKSMRLLRKEELESQMTAKRGIMLTPLIDIFVALVFFLMFNTGDVDILEPDSSIKLPESVAEQRPNITAVIKIDAEQIFVGGRAVAAIDDVINGEGNIIEGLQSELTLLASRKLLTTESEKKNGLPIIIMGDKNTHYQVIKKIMSTCATSDYRDISFAVSHTPGAITPDIISASAVEEAEL